MEKIKKVYIDSRYRTVDASSSDSDFKFELKEAIDLPENTVCYIDAICIPHTWRSIENHNNKLHIIIKRYLPNASFINWSWNPYVLTIPEGNYTGSNLASAIQEQLSFIQNVTISVSYSSARGTINISSTQNEGVVDELYFIVASDFGAMTSTLGGGVPWRDRDEHIISVDPNNLQYINNVLRHTDMFQVDVNSEYHRSYASGFIDLLRVHNIYIHSEHIGNYNTIGVRGENSIITKVPVSSSLGYLIIDSVVAPHDKIDVSRQTIQTIHFTLRYVHGNVITLHGANISLSLIFQTIE